MCVIHNMGAQSQYIAKKYGTRTNYSLLDSPWKVTTKNLANQISSFIDFLLIFKLFYMTTLA
jgi:hypothetical protein